jgi:nitroreductase
MSAEYQEHLDQVVAAAVRAPSVHNTQPWRLVTGPDTLEVRADRSRQLLAQDPVGRELMISCGGAAEHARVAARGLGLSCRLEWLPDPADADLVARLHLGPVQTASPQESLLLEAVAIRRSDRSAFDPTEVPHDVVDVLVQVAQEDGVHLGVEQRPDRVLALEVLVARADQLTRRDPELQADLHGWVRAESHPQDGVPADALPDHGAGRGSSLALRDFDPESTPAGVTGAEPPVPEHPLLLLLSTEGDEPADWVRTGSALSRVWLTATSLGVVLNPQTQLLEVPHLREQLRAQLGMPGQPQMLLRAGYPTGPGSPVAGRRPASDVLEDLQ